MSTDANPTAGGTPGSAGTAGQAGGTPGSQQPPTSGTGGTPGDGGTPSTPEDVTGLKSALEAERLAKRQEAAARAAIEKELNDLRTATQSEQDKARAETEKQIRGEERAKAEGPYRALRVEISLVGAGMKPGMARDLATSARFAALPVNEDYSVDQAALDAAIEELKKAEPSYFGGAQPAGQVSRGPQHQSSAAANASPGVGRLRAAYEATSKK